MTKTYNHRYYANYCKEKGHVTGWYDIESLTHTDNVPEEKDLHPLTEEEWNTRKTNGHGVRDGKLVDHIQKYEPPIHELAQDLLSSIRKHITEEYLMMNKQVPAALVEYQTALKKVINGESDTIPEAPSS